MPEGAGIEHCYTCPRCPKMKALGRRFNRTVQEEFTNYAGRQSVWRFVWVRRCAVHVYGALQRRVPTLEFGEYYPCQAIGKQLPHLSSIY